MYLVEQPPHYYLPRTTLLIKFLLLADFFVDIYCGSPDPLHYSGGGEGILFLQGCGGGGGGVIIKKKIKNIKKKNSKGN
jgi:hypothetical protein